MELLPDLFPAVCPLSTASPVAGRIRIALSATSENGLATAA